MPIYEPQEDSYLLQEFVRKLASGRVLDLGTGSGIQAITAAKLKRVIKVLAVDINKDAVKELNQLKEKYLFSSRRSSCSPLSRTKNSKNKLCLIGKKSNLFSCKSSHFVRDLAYAKQSISSQDNFDLAELTKYTKIKTKVSDLFSNLSGKFDTIIFNPPYLPQDAGIEDAALYGGKKGWEISERFFNEAAKFLKPNGIILFLFSSYTNKPKIDEIVQNNLFESELLGSKKFDFFEELFVYKITKTKLLQELEKKNITNIHFLARGKRGIVYSGTWKNKSTSKMVAIKTSNPHSTALGRIDNEAKWLITLNKKQIGPEFYFSGQDYLVMELIAGERIDKWIGKKHPKDKILVIKKQILKILIELLQQCYIMDEMGMSKEELHHPYKHIIINKYNKPIMIDFERCHHTDKSTNVTQFLEYICRSNNYLKEKNIFIDIEQIRKMAKEYRNYSNKDTFTPILNYLRRC